MDEVVTLLHNAGVTLKLRKCAFFKTTVEYLGHEITPGHLGILEANTRGLRDVTHPETKTQLGSYLGLCNVYRRSAKDIARVSTPLNDLTSKLLPKKLPLPSEYEMQAFKTMKEAILLQPMLSLPRSTGTSVIDVDASDTQIGCTLLQVRTIVVRSGPLP